MLHRVDAAKPPPMLVVIGLDVIAALEQLRDGGGARLVEDFWSLPDPNELAVRCGVVNGACCVVCTVHSVL